MINGNQRTCLIYLSPFPFHNSVTLSPSTFDTKHLSFHSFQGTRTKWVIGMLAIKNSSVPQLFLVIEDIATTFSSLCVFSQRTLQLWQPKWGMQNFNDRGKYPNVCPRARPRAHEVFWWRERALSISPSWTCSWSSWQLIQLIFEGVTRICTFVCKYTSGFGILQCAAETLWPLQ